MPSPYTALRPLLFCVSAEGAHHGAIGLGKLGQRLPFLTRRLYRSGLTEGEAARLRTRVMGLDFASPVGLAAGADKNAELVPFWEQIGCGFCEVGSVSALPSQGNPKPRAFRLPADDALINRMGLNNHGAERVARRIAGMERPAGFPLGINIAKTHSPEIMGQDAMDDFLAATATMMPLADFVVLNVSCPNTAEGKTFEDPETLAALLERVRGERERQGLEVPVLVKLSPPPVGDDGEPRIDAGALAELMDLVFERGVSGIVATNTASDRAGLRSPTERVSAIGKGGLSGAPLARRALAMTRALRKAIDGRGALIGVGGIDSAEAAYARIRAGADLVEVYTGLVYQGPGLVRAIGRGLARALERDGFASVSEAVGADVG